MAQSRKNLLLLVLAFIALWAVFSLGTYSAWIHGADHKDFYPWWAASRLHLFKGLDPYDPATTRQMQILLYGQPIPPERDQQAFHYPAQLMVILFPFWLINQVEIAASLWDGLSVLMLFASLILLTRYFPDKRPAWLVPVLLVWIYPLLAIYQAQSTALPLFSLTLAFWAFQNRRDVLAGAVSSLALVKPELALIPWLCLLVLAVRQRRWKLVAAFFSAHVILFLLSIAVAGWWLPGWLGAIGRYSGYAASTWVPVTLWNASPVLLFILPLLLLLIVLKTHWTETNLLVASIPLCLLVLPQTLVWNMTMLVVPLVVSWRGKGRWIAGAIWLTAWAMLLFPNTWQWQYVLLPSMSIAALALAFHKTIGLPFRRNVLQKEISK